MHAGIGISTLQSAHDDDSGRASSRQTQHPLHLAILLGLSSALGLATEASAATFTVLNTNDSGADSLRAAIQAANGAAGPDTITFDSSVTGTITLTTGRLNVYDDTTITGPGASTLTVSGNGTAGVFQCSSSSASLGALSISGLSITGGYSAYGGGVLGYDCPLSLDSTVISGNSAGQFGGGVAALGLQSSLEISNSTISGNIAFGGGGVATAYHGGSVAITNSTISGNIGGVAAGGILGLFTYGATVERSTVSGNSTGSGGGIGTYFLYGPLTVENSTISGNTAVGGKGGGYGGGIAAAYFYSGGSSIRHSTIAANYASEYGGGLSLYEGGQNERFPRPSLSQFPNLKQAWQARAGAKRAAGSVKGNGATVVIDHTILGDNTAGAGGSSDDIDINVPTSVTFSLIESAITRGGIIDDGGNIFGQDPALGTLADNGGPTLTHLPASDSPAVDSGDVNIVDPPATDQRGFARIFGSQIDMGAVEFGATGGSPGEITFELANYTIGETDLTKAVATINVMRLGGTVGAVSVDYATSDGTAMAPDDYLPANGTLSWADGIDSPQSFSLTVNADLLVEGEETFNLTLSNVQGGAVLGANPSVTVTIPANGFAGAQSIPAGDWRGLGTILVGVLLAGWLALRGRSQA